MGDNEDTWLPSERSAVWAQAFPAAHPLCDCVYRMGYWENSQYEPARETLVAGVTETATSDIAAAKIWIGRRYEALRLCVAFDDAANIAALAGLLQGANPSPAPGHVNPEFDFRLDINSKGSGRTHYHGTTYLQFQDDAYIWPSGKGNSVSRLDKIQVPKLGTWLRELARENGCY